MYRDYIVEWFIKNGYGCEIIEDNGVLVRYAISKGDVSFNMVFDVNNPNTEQVLEFNRKAFDTLLDIREKELRRQARKKKKT